MPKKLKGENSKAVEARVRKEAAKTADQERKQQAEEDELWRDDDKHILRKQQRKENKDKKKQEQAEHKKALHDLAEEEMASMKGAKAPPSKVTRAQIAEREQKEREAAEAAAAKPKLSHDEVPLEENINHQISMDEGARTVEDAISVLSVSSPAEDRHPERRMKAAFAAFEEHRLATLKQENPNMRLSQLKQMVKKEWMKSPENPLNQRNASFNS